MHFKSLISGCAATCLVAIIALCLAWELWLAPLRPGGSMLALKALPLLLPLFGVLRGSRYTFQWSSMLILAYVAEGSVRTFTDSDLSRFLSVLELLLACTFFFLAIAFVRYSPRDKLTSVKAED